MAGFADVLLRGLILVLGSIALGGVAWSCYVLRAGAGNKPDRFTARALSVTAWAAAGVAVAQAAVMVVALAALAEQGPWPVRLYFQTGFAAVAVARVGLGLALAVVALRVASRPAGRAAWGALIAAAVGLIASSAFLSHAIARVEGRALPLALDAVHQLAAALWIGGLAQLVLYGAKQRHEPDGREGIVVRRFSGLALVSVAALTAAGVALTVLYVGDAAGLVGTAYGIMILSKVTLFAIVLSLAFANFRAVRRSAGAAPGLRVSRYAEVELGLGITILFAAASLTSLPPAVDVVADRATVAEVAARFAPSPPRLSSPPVRELIAGADPLMASAGNRTETERAWSEYNHHWAGFFVIAMGLLTIVERLGVRAARHWPLVFFGLAAFLFVRNDPRAWPLGPAGFWESLTLPDVLQHRAFVLLVVAFGLFEWMVRTGRLRPQPWALVFPLLCAVGGGLLLTHSHAMFNLKDEFLIEVTHAPLGILGLALGWARWLELRLPAAGPGPGWLWRTCLTAVGVLLLIYRES
jgi:putative copper resistance protein D